jgi:uracil-DNA glycosylase family 4
MDALASGVVSCRACPRLVAWREQVARERRAAYAAEEYWGRPVPGFGDPRARLLVVGLAPAAHGANRTGRMFTGDRSGDWLFRALFRAGFADRPESVRRDDGLRLRDCWVTAAVRCAPPDNTPTTVERETCRHWLVEEMALLDRVRVVVALGGVAWATVLGIVAASGLVLPRPRPRFGHGVRCEPAPLAGSRRPAPILLASYHPSQQNTFTGRLTEEGLDSVFATAGGIIGGLG